MGAGGGGGGEPLTVTVALADALPPVPVHESVKVDVALSAPVLCDPEVASSHSMSRRPNNS